MRVRTWFFWGWFAALASACGNDGGSPRDRGDAGDAGDGGSAGSASEQDGGEPENAAGSDASGAGATASNAGAAGNTSSGGAAGETSDGGGAGETATAGAAGASRGGALRVDETRGGACGSEPDRCLSRSLDADGKAIGGFEDQDCDGVPDTQCTAVERWEGGSRVELDMNCDGQPETCVIDVVLTNDDTRPPVGETCERAGACTTNLRDAAGNLLGYEQDENCDGQLEACLYLVEEPAGTYSGGHDIGCDGTVDVSCTIKTVDASTGHVREELDSDCNGEPNDVFCSLEKETDAETASGRDLDCDGTLDADCFTWTYDEAERPLTLSRDAECDGTFETSCTTFSYDDDGNSRAETDLTCDRANCTVSLGHPYTGAPGSSVDAGCDGVIESNCELWTRDDEGRPIRLDHDHDCDGTPSLAPDSSGACWTTWTYTPI